MDGDMNVSDVDVNANVTHQHHPTMTNRVSVSSEEHTRFLSALEKHGSAMTGDEWYNMASDMNWSVDDTKIYAFWYFHHLANETHHDRPTCRDVDAGMFISESGTGTGTGSCSGNGERANDDDTKGKGNAFDTEWTYEECILFDNLLIQYPHESGTTTTTNPHLRWDKVATKMPNKSASDCKQRYDWYKKCQKE